jgi:hypothetical protein
MPSLPSPSKFTRGHFENPPYQSRENSPYRTTVNSAYHAQAQARGVVMNQSIKIKYRNSYETSAALIDNRCGKMSITNPVIRRVFWFGTKA